ncbi:uncharacterized protein LOC111804099 isoform X2 [Cucurbita pepo subsp. pepo]|uniref:uncharacterized protein LOC111804099 isoform X2 n=1 Tax=Cucurbita pepo subsp. pepo TaxID=3664 RepID=UPI000C9D5511|nr:uncharacterized protein LOC111804099 isoform X2 [Cucurbita pepo subsp. pepo]
MFQESLFRGPSLLRTIFGHRPFLLLFGLCQSSLSHHFLSHPYKNMKLKFMNRELYHLQAFTSNFTFAIQLLCTQFSFLHLNMGQNSNGLEWFMNVFKKMEDRCLEMCDVLEKEVLKYVEGQLNSVDINEDHFQQPRLDVGEDQSPEKAYCANQNASSSVAFGNVPGEHLVKTEDGKTIQASKKQNHLIIEPNHFSANQKIENKNAKANISWPSRKQSQKPNAITDEILKCSPSTIQNDEFPDWEIV